VFGYSDEDGTEAATLPGKVSAATVRRRTGRLAELADLLCAQRAEERIGTEVVVLVETAESETEDAVGRAAHQAPEVDGECVFLSGDVPLVPGAFVRAEVTDAAGADLVVRALEVLVEPRLAVGVG